MFAGRSLTVKWWAGSRSDGADQRSRAAAPSEYAIGGRLRFRSGVMAAAQRVESGMVAAR
jgi:hypothetical protein